MEFDASTSISAMPTLAGLFTVVLAEADTTRTKVAVSFALKEKKQRTQQDFRIVAVDSHGKRQETKNEEKASATFIGLKIMTLVPEFNLSSDKIDALVTQEAAGK